jgi:hypothetical protein
LEELIISHEARWATENSLDTSNTLNNEIFSSNSTSLVETADIDPSSERNPERLGTEDSYHQLHPYLKFGRAYRIFEGQQGKR